MTEFFHNRFDQSNGSLSGSSEQSVIEAFSDPKEYNQKYVDQANLNSDQLQTYAPDSTACSTSGFVTNTCVKEYAYNADKYDKLTLKNNTLNGSFGDGKEKNSEIIISNINLGIGIAIMLSYIYSMT